MPGVYEEILEWSTKLPTWQRDALRRLADGTLTSTDIDELLQLCLSQVGLSVPGLEAVTAQPLLRKHLPIAGPSDADVVLNSVHSVQHVNRLDPHATLPFASAGLTIIYGDNASGKSGYVRILKKTCRARHSADPIHPDIFSDPPDEPAAAIITFTEGTLQAKPYNWKDIPHSQPPSPLSRISVFDAKCGALYISEYNDVAYRPFGLVPC